MTPKKDDDWPDPLDDLGGWALPEKIMCLTCDARKAARERGEFVYLASWGGYIFTDTPERRMSYGAPDKLRAYTPWDRDVPDTNGTRITWITCPFCGCPLPPNGDGDLLADPNE